MINCVEAFSFDDLMLIPKFSDVKSRSSIDLSIKLCKGFEFVLPFTPSNMKTIMSPEMARVFYEEKALAIFHRFAPLEEQLSWLKSINEWEKGNNYIGFSIGVKKEDYQAVDTLVNNGAKILLIDIAHGHSEHCVAMTQYIASKYPNVLLISGNVATGDGARALFKAGADIVKVNVGSGSLCSTRITTGCGLPSLTSLSDCYDSKKELERYLGRKLFLMQDGGVKNSGDISKALCFADIVMSGSLFSATDQTPGKIFEQDNLKYKLYTGSSTHKTNHREGIEALKIYKGDVHPIIQQLKEGIASACSYQGVHKVSDLQKDPRFVKISTAGYRESAPHDFDILIK